MNFKIFLTPLFIIFFLTSCQNFQSQHPLLIERTKGYVEGSDDIPLLKELKLINEDSTNFDTMSGNITISKYVGMLKLEEARNFYLQILPQLGWNLDKSDTEFLSFTRETNKLEITFSHKSKGLYVKFFISSLL